MLSVVKSAKLVFTWPPVVPTSFPPHLLHPYLAPSFQSYLVYSQVFCGSSNPHPSEQQAKHTHCLDSSSRPTDVSFRST